MAEAAPVSPESVAPAFVENGDGVTGAGEGPRWLLSASDGKLRPSFSPRGWMLATVPDTPSRSRSRRRIRDGAGPQCNLRRTADHDHEREREPKESGVPGADSLVTGAPNRRQLVALRAVADQGSPSGESSFRRSLDVDVTTFDRGCRTHTTVTRDVAAGLTQCAGPAEEVLEDARIPWP